MTAGRNPYLWLQTIGGGTGDQIDPVNIPADRIAMARGAIDMALKAGEDGALIPQRLGVRLRATAERRRLLLTLLGRDGAPLVTIAVAPRDRDGAKLWPMMAKAAADQGQSMSFARPREPWAVVLAYTSVMQFAGTGDVAWLPMIEAELACAWLEMIRDD
ncbi:MAG: hypothetical protein ABS87_07940 [Sphingomonas sp. SCN 67-18]|nr:hypothetical protein [Sphingomonas sp. SCN 67-18]ODU21117.1 MAG: hypothetical protein ABS87_07940 [Sphingomonas sp. SCN 67-18]